MGEPKLAPRIPIIDENDPTAPMEAREFLKEMEIQRGGHVFNALRMLANHPRQATLLMNFAQSVRYESTLDTTLAELAYLTASTVNRCHY